MEDIKEQIQVRSGQVVPATTVRQPAKCGRRQDVWPNKGTDPVGDGVGDQHWEKGTAEVDIASRYGGGEQEGGLGEGKKACGWGVKAVLGSEGRPRGGGEVSGGNWGEEEEGN